MMFSSVKVIRLLGTLEFNAGSQSEAHNAVLNAIAVDRQIAQIDRIGELCDLYEAAEKAAKEDPDKILPTVYWIGAFEALLVVHHGTMFSTLCEAMGRKRYWYGLNLIPIIVVSALRAAVTLEELYPVDLPEELLDPVKIGNLVQFSARLPCTSTQKLPIW